MNSNPVVEISNRREPSGRRLNANRANAQKSAGPTTPEGKAISSRNALVHGLCAATFLIETEDPAEFNAVRGCYYTRFGPRDQVENDLVDKIVHAIWNEKRAWAMEHESINIQMVKMAPDFAAKFSELSSIARAALAFSELAGAPSLPLLHRYAARLSNEFHRSLKTLRELQKNVPLLPPGTPVPTPLDDAGPDLPNEPTSENEHSSALTTNHQPLTTSQALTTNHQPLTTAEAKAPTAVNAGYLPPQPQSESTANPHQVNHLEAGRPIASDTLPERRPRHGDDGHQTSY